MKHLFFSKLVASVVIATVSGAASLFAQENTAELNTNHPNVRAAMAAQKELTPDVMKKPEVLGTAIGANASDRPVLIIYVDRESQNAGEIIRNLPKESRGFPIQIELTDKFRAQPGKPGSTTTTVSHTAPQAPPIQLGTSGGWRSDLANGYCCGGTLGSLVSINGTQFILSNYHVLEADIVLGGNNVIAQTGDPVIQPGLIDIGCDANRSTSVAVLVKKSALPQANVDCAIAQVSPGMVAADGSILEIGPLSSQIIPAALRQAVKKSGRTTGLTRSSISGLNATINVSYENECAGAPAFTKTFVGQIVISNRNNVFLNGGDSGSLLVEDVKIRPRAVGLLFAGSSTDAIANPIGEVLNFLGATMVGN